MAAPATTLAPLTAEAAERAGILPALHWQQAQHEDEADDTDTASAIGSVLSSTASLSESIFEYRNILGRTYHSDIGIWAIDFADEFPNTEIIGTDVSPNQPTWVPPNVKFEIDDCNQGWTWPDNTFDYIHLRNLIGVVDDWEAYYCKAFRVCKPGGYVEDFTSFSKIRCDDGTMKEESALNQWGKVFFEGGNKFGRTFSIVEDDLQRKGMEKAGFTDIAIKDIKSSISPWSEDKHLNDIGTWIRVAWTADLEGYVNYLWGAVVGWSQDEIKSYLAVLKRELYNTKIHAYFITRLAYGRKPESAA